MLASNASPTPARRLPWPLTDSWKILWALHLFYLFLCLHSCPIISSSSLNSCPFISCRLSMACDRTCCCYSVIHPLMLITYVIVSSGDGGLGLVVVAVVTSWYYALTVRILLLPLLSHYYTYSERLLIDKDDDTYIQCSEPRQQSDVIRQVSELIGWEQQFGEVSLFPPAIGLIEGHVLLGLLRYVSV